MELRCIRTFLRIAETGSFSGAAALQGYSQSAVTVQIRQLEEQLGAPLFDRIGKRVRLTDAGERFLPYAQDILNAVEKAEHFSGDRESVSGRLRIAAAESLLFSVLPPVLRELHRRCPGVQITTYTGTLEELVDKLAQNEADVLYLLDRSSARQDWIKAAQRQEPIVFAAGAGHPLAKKEHISIDDILSQPLILTERHISYRFELEQLLAAEGKVLRPYLETGNTEMIARILESGDSVSFLPLYAVQERIRQGTLKRLDVHIPQVVLHSQLIYHKNKWVTPQMRFFTELLRQFTGQCETESERIL